MTFKDSPLFIESDLAVAQSDFLGLTSEKKKMTSEKTGFTSEKSPSTSENVISSIQMSPHNHRKGCGAKRAAPFGIYFYI